MAFAASAWAQEQRIVALGKEATGGEIEDQAAVHLGIEGEIEVVERLADSDEENRSFRADDDQIVAERRCQKYCGAGDRHGSR